MYRPRLDAVMRRVSSDSSKCEFLLSIWSCSMASLLLGLRAIDTRAEDKRLKKARKKKRKPLRCASSCKGRTCGDYSCGEAPACCNRHCTDTSADETNCGGCGVTCPVGELVPSRFVHPM